MNVSPKTKGESSSRAAGVHQLFRGAAEVTKKVRQLALALEFGAAIFATMGALEWHTPWGNWNPLVILALMALGLFLRIWARSTHGYSERCRRTSVKAFALDLEIGAPDYSELVSDTPMFTEKLAINLPAESLIEYYEPTMASGPKRHHEIYAHSSFYSWRLLRFGFRLFVWISVTIISLAAAVVYGLVLKPTELEATIKVLDATLSLLVVVFALKSLDTTAFLCIAASEEKKIADGLIKVGSHAEINDFISRYDIERASGPLPQTFVYKVLRDNLQKEWKERRKALAELN